ncbi:MAG: hypothetical protein M3513_16635, partial [Actinomycetota bacterium]|nr:hypothetical protein [Actinomycetota bacterium]
MRRRSISLAAAAAMVVAGLSVAAPAAIATPDVLPASVPDQLLVGYEPGASAASRAAAQDAVS